MLLAPLSNKRIKNIINQQSIRNQNRHENQGKEHLAVGRSEHESAGKQNWRSVMNLVLDADVLAGFAKGIPVEQY